MEDTKIFSESAITEISKVLGNALNGSEITKILSNLKLSDYIEVSTKWKRLEFAFTECQRRDQSRDAILRFIGEALNPERFSEKPAEFEKHLEKLNRILLFSGLQYMEDGSFESVAAAKTIGEAASRTQSLLRKLEQRGIHERVIQYCNEELLKDNYFHAVFEATKSLSDRVREMTGLMEDGAPLYEKAFSTTHPYLRLNDLQTDSAKSQQTGFRMMLIGINSMVRNVTAHTPKIKWAIDEDEAADILTTISFLHKNLDSCQAVRTEPRKSDG